MLGLALKDRSEDVIIGTKVRLASEDMFDITAAVQRSIETSFKTTENRGGGHTPCPQSFHAEQGRYTQLIGSRGRNGTGIGSVPVGAKVGEKQDSSAYRPWSTFVPTLNQIMGTGDWDTVLAYYNLLNWTAQSKPPPGVKLFDNGQNILLAKKHNMGVIGIRSHAAGRYLLDLTVLYLTITTY
ncbi:MAG: hypothetical protein CM1200mP22_29770 [Dehalococcoidia bacterium]|nr:MAG: hypothetical protein CM1200mP22_29770 [Dehalococcoidia bacterium]